MAVADRIFRKHLTCCICMELYRGPKTLPCMHSFCERCLSGHVCADSRIVNGFLCPLCKAFTLPSDPEAQRHHWANQFTTDFKLANMLEEIDQIEKHGPMSKTRAMLLTTRGGLLGDKRTLLEAAEETKAILTRLHVDQETVLEQLADAFLAARQKLLSKEENLKKKLRLVYEEQRRGVEESWKKTQRLASQAGDLIADVERIVTPSRTTDTDVDVQTFHSKHTQFVAEYTGLDVPEVNFDITFRLRKNDLAKIDSVAVCEIDQKARMSVPGESAPSSPRERESISSTLDGDESSMMTTISPPGTPGVPGRTVAQLVTTMMPENDSNCADFQDIAVMHVKGVQIVVLTDDKYNVTAMYSDHNSMEYKTLKVAGHPYRICRLDSTRVAVSVNNPQRVIIIQVYPNLQKLAVLKTWQGNHHDKDTHFGVTALDANTLAVARKNKIKIVTTDDCDLADFKLKTDGNIEPWYMTTHPKGYIIVSDRAGEMVYCTTQTGQILWQWKAPVVPAGVACDRDGNIYVALPDKLKIQRLNENGQSVGDAVNRNCGLLSAYGIDVDEYGHMYVLVQTRSHSIQIFNKQSALSVGRKQELAGGVLN